jgi:UDP-glucose 4-epimerase
VAPRAARAEVSERDRFRALVEREAPAAIVHLAAPASVPQSFADPHADFLGHMVPLANVLDAARLSAGGARVILISSAAVYGNPESLPVDEGASLAPISPYAFHKIQQELLLDEYVTLHGVRACKVRLFSTYGENQRRLAVWEMTRRALAGDVHVLGSGEETRDYLYAGDAARAVVRIAEAAQCAGEAINVSSGQEVSIRELAAEIYRLAGITAPPQFTGEQMPGSPTRWRADVTRLRALGFDPPGWAAGLAQTIDWIRTEP